MSVATEIRTIVADELQRIVKLGARQRSDALSELVSELARGVSISLAVGLGGNKEGINEMLEGTTQYMFEEAANYQKVGAALGGKVNGL